jgi:hypothetical protein
MADDSDDDLVEDASHDSFEDPIAERARSFVLLATCADSLRNETARELTFTFMRKLTASIRTPSTAEVVSITGGKS